MKQNNHVKGSILSLMITLGYLAQIVAAVNGASPIPAATPICRYPNTQAFSVIDTSWGKAGTPVEAGPGSQRLPLIVTLHYDSDCAATVVKATLGPLPSGFTDINGAPTSTVYTSNVVGYSVVQLTFYLNLASTVSVGTYTLPLDIAWDNILTFSLTQTLAATIQLRGIVKLNFSPSQTTLNPGQVNTVTVSLNNTGSGDASQVEVTASGPQSISILNQVTTIPTLKPGSSSNLNFTFYVSPAAAGSPITASMAAKYVDAYGNTQTTIQSLGFYVPSVQYSSPVSVAIEQFAVTPGAVNNITISISNNGEEQMSSISVSLPGSAAITWLQSSTFQHKLLPPSESFSIQAQAYEAQNAPSSVSVQVSLTYYDANGTIHQELHTLGLLSRGIIDLKVTDYAVLPEKPVPGGAFSITTTLTNLGTVAASSLTAIPRPPAGFTVFGAASYFIGDLQVSTPTPFTVSLLIDDTTSPGTYVIPIALNYSDNLRQEMAHTISLSVTVGVPTSPTGGNGGASLFAGLGPASLIILGIVIAGVIIVPVWLYMRRRSS